MKTLEELKAENAEAEVKAEEAPVTPEVETEEEVAKEETQDSVIPAEDEEEEGEETKVEAWMQTEEQASEGAEKKFTNDDMAGLRHKMKAKLEDSNGEIEKLRAENEALRRGGSQQAAQTDQLPPRPKREDFDFDDDAYDSAMDAWYDKRTDAKLAARDNTQTVTQQQKDAQDGFTKSVDQHYERAATLVKDAGISAEMYQSSDKNVRSMIENIRPGNGDLIAEQLIATLGEGSEKVMYYIGRNQNALNGLQNAIIADPSGMKAMMYLGQTASKVVTPQQRKSRAPTPATQIKGDASESSSAKAFKKQYDAAAKSGNVQKKFDARRAAKKANVDVSNW